MDLRAQDIEDLLPYLNDDERRELERLLSLVPSLWLPQPGPQSDAFHHTADILGFGGAAGGGKTDLAAGLTLTAHQRTLYVRRQKVQTAGFVQRIEQIIGTRDGYNSQTSEWRIGVRHLTIAGCDNPGDEKKQQGIPRDFHIYDEVTEQREWQVRYMMGWNRTDIVGQRVRTLMNFNPPTTAEGRWVLRYFGPWLDRKSPKRAAPGEVLWMTSIGDNHDVVVPDNRPFVIHERTKERIYDFDPGDYRGERQVLIINPRSRTFIPSRVTDNPFYVRTGYIATLQELPEPLRSQMLKGDFVAGLEDDANQLIPTDWIEASMRRWRPREAKGIMDSLGVDVSRGNMGGMTTGASKDRTVIAPRYGTWFDQMSSLRGIDVNDGPAVASQVIKRRRDNAVVHIDIVGVGTAPYDFLNANHVQVVGINGGAKSLGTDKSGQLGFANLRSELYWRMREALDPNNPDPIYLPDDAELLADLAAPRWWLTPQGIMVEPKRGKPTADGKATGLIARLGRSPDRGDAAVYALVSTPKRNVIMGGFAGLPPQPYDRNRELTDQQRR